MPQRSNADKGYIIDCTCGRSSHCWGRPFRWATRDEFKAEAGAEFEKHVVTTMPKAKPYRAKDGTTSYRVRYRLDGTSTSTTFRGPPNAAKREADAFAKMVHAVGPADALAWQRRNDGQHIGSSMPLNDWASRIHRRPHRSHRRHHGTATNAHGP